MNYVNIRKAVREDLHRGKTHHPWRSVKQWQGDQSQWRGVFGNVMEVITFEAKIEQGPSQLLAAKDIGQAHNQRARAEREYPGYTVRGTIVTHLTALASDAESAVGSIKILEKKAPLALWDRAKLLLSRYRGI